MSDIWQSGELRDLSGREVVVVRNVVSAVLQGVSAIEDINRRNSDVTVYPSAARTAAPTTAVLPDNFYCRGVRLVLDITATAATTGTLQRVIEHFDPAAAAGAGRWVPIYTEATFTGTSVSGALPKSKVLSISPDFAATDATNVDDIKVNSMLGRAWRVRVVHSDGSSWTYSLGATLLI